VAAAFTQYRVVGFYSDVSQFESYVDKWSADYSDTVLVKASPRSAVGWDMRGRHQLGVLGTERLVAPSRTASSATTAGPCCGDTS
jgi:hypothetical protein